MLVSDSDTNIINLPWTITKYIDDVRKLFASFISKEDSDLRTEIDYSFNPMSLKQVQDSSDFYLEDVRLEDFAAKQIARRIKNRVETDRAIGKYISVTENDGYFDSGKFTFILGTELKEAVDRADLDSYLLEISLRIAAEVFDMYGIKDFSYVAVTDKRSGKIIAVKPENLRKYKTKRLTIK